ncbi:MAG: SDR family oxidoreductase [Vicinamibacterales bacterium]
MNLVVGATGMLGFEICQRLRARGHPVRAFVRKGSSKEQLLQGIGAEIVHGDLKDESSLEAACRGASVVITTANPIVSRRPGDTLETVDRDGSLALVRAAKAAGVRQFIYTSVTPRLPANNTFVRYKREVEGVLRASGLNWTILQPCAFMEINTGPLAGWDLRKGRARLIGSGRVPLCYIAVADVAAFAVAAVDQPKAFNRNLHITGPEPITGLDAVEIAERVTGQTFTVHKVPIAALRVVRAVLQPFNPILASLLAMGIGAQDGEGADMEPLLREFAVEPTTFEHYVRVQTAGGRS